MSDYISRQAAVEWFMPYLHMEEKIPAETVLEDLRNIPAADAAPVVRCKDCIYREKAAINGKGFLICPASGMEITDTDFCSYGERKGGTMSDCIKDHLPEEMILGQLMEECGELIQAAHKIIRQRQGVNLPHTDHPPTDDLEEEIADVMLCVSLLSCIDGDKIERWIIAKEGRWEQRLREESQC